MLGECIHTIANSHGLAISLFLGGLMGGFTHCAGMCSPFVLAQTGPDFSLKRAQERLLLPYHLGRMTTYISLAVLVSGFINIAFLFSDMKSLIAVPLLMTASLIFLISAFPSLSSAFPWIGRIQIGIPFSLLRKPITKLISSQSVLGRYMLGILLGFMPCGLVAAALMAASTASSIPESALAMAAFTMGTMPALILVSFGGSALKQRFPKTAQRFSQGAMAISSLWLFALAGTMIF